MIEIVRMSEENFRGVAKIEAECFTQPWSEKTFHEELSNKNARTYVALCDNAVAGFLSVWVVCDEISINNIAVSDKFRRMGIAKKLLESMESSEVTAFSATLEVRKSNVAAIKLYENFGFEKVGERKDFYIMPSENALLMTKFYREG